MYTSGTTYARDGLGARGCGCGLRPVSLCARSGVPKGAMLTHGNLMACISGVVRGQVRRAPLSCAVGALHPRPVLAVPVQAKLYSSDVFLSYLPLAHIFESVVQVALFLCGAAIGFYSVRCASVILSLSVCTLECVHQGNVKLLTDDIQCA